MEGDSGAAAGIDGVFETLFMDPNCRSEPDIRALVDNMVVAPRSASATPVTEPRLVSEVSRPTSVASGVIDRPPDFSSDEAPTRRVSVADGLQEVTTVLTNPVDIDAGQTNVNKSLFMVSSDRQASAE